MSRRGAVVDVVRGHWYDADSHTGAVRGQLCSDEDNESPQALVVFVAWRGVLVSWWMRLERRGSGTPISRTVIGRYSAAFEHVQHNEGPEGPGRD